MTVSQTADASSRCDAVLAGVGWAYFSFAYAVEQFHIPYVNFCPYAHFTGSPCPLCGATRFIGALLHGQITPPDIFGVGLVWFVLMAYMTFRYSASVIMHGRHFRIGRLHRSVCT
jgi:hypothetical protein